MKTGFYWIQRNTKNTAEIGYYSCGSGLFTTCASLERKKPSEVEVLSGQLVQEDDVPKDAISFRTEYLWISLLLCAVVILVVLLFAVVFGILG